MRKHVKKVCLGILIASIVFSGLGNYLSPNMFTAYAEQTNETEPSVGVITPLAKYEFQDAENPGKDTMGNYDLVTRVSDGCEEGNVAVNSGVATFNGTAGLIPESNDKDISEALSSFTLAFDIQLSETLATDWSVPVGFGWNDWNATKWGNFHIADNNTLLRFSTHTDGSTEAYWGSELGTLSAQKYSTVILSAQLGGKMTVYLDGLKVYEKDLPSDYSLQDDNMRFAIGGTSCWGNLYKPFYGSLADVRVYDFSFSKAQIVQYLLEEDVYQDSETGLEETIDPLAKYEFQDAANPGKDTMDNYHLKTRDMDGLPEGTEGSVSVSDGVATFNGTAALIANDDNDIGDSLQSFTLAFKIKAENTHTDWATPIGFGWNQWGKGDGITKWGNFSLSSGSQLLRFSTHTVDGTEEQYWGKEIGDITNSNYSTVVLSAQLGGKMKVYLNGVEKYSYDLPSDYSLQDPLMRFALGGASCWGNAYHPFYGSLADVRVYDFAFDETQLVQYMIREDVYEVSEVLREVVDPIAKYEFQDAENPGKDTMDNYHLKTRDMDGLPEGTEGSVSVSDGVATFNGTAALIANDDNDIGDNLQSFTLAFKIKAENTHTDWATPIGFGWNQWGKNDGITKWGNFSLSGGSQLLRFSTHTVDGTEDQYWGKEIGDITNSNYSTVVLSAQLGGKMKVYLNGVETYSYDLPTNYSLQDADMRFAIGGSSCWGNAYQPFYGSLTDVRIYDFAFDETQMNRYMSVGDVYTEKIVKDFTAEEYATYRANGAGNYTAPTAPEGYVFGGWFTDSNCERALTTDTIQDETCAYAKFVDEDVLSVQCQIPVTTTMDDEETTLRVVTAVDSLKYSMVGFEVTVEGDASSTLYTTRDAYTDIKAKIGSTTISYMPNELSIEARYFMAVAITGVPNEVFTKNITITPAWKTLDGTIVSVNQKSRSDINIQQAILSNATEFTAITYNDIPTVDDIKVYHSEVKKTVNDKKVHNDDPVENGVVNCPYYTLKINDVDVPVYSTRCGKSVHSFAWIDIDEAETDIVLNAKLSLQNTHDKVVVLPQSSGVVPKMDDNVVSAQITSLGSFSFAFDDNVSEALTIYVAREEKLDVPSGYNVQEFEPGTYQASNTTFTDENTVYYFKKGIYGISSISLPSNSMLYFENGTYVDVITESEDDTNAAITSKQTTNVEVCGRALFDFSQSQGGDSKIKGVYDFVNVDMARFSGITTINSNSWSICFTDCNDVVVEDNMLFGYRTYSDGIMISDCQNSVIRNNFVRTGDDAIEVKSTSHYEETSNIVFEYNAVWTDKAGAYGCIYECNNPVKNVVFRNNSVGFAKPTWSDKLGCCTVVMGNNGETTWEDIYFEDMEIYYSASALINIDLEGSSDEGTGGQVKNLYFRNIHAYMSEGLTVRIDVDSSSSLGNVYLDDIQYNGVQLQADDINSSDKVSITNVNSEWSPSEYIFVNTLTEE